MPEESELENMDKKWGGPPTPRSEQNQMLLVEADG